MEGAALFFILIALTVLVVWIWSLIHCIKNPQLTDTMKIIGVVLIVVLGLIGISSTCFFRGREDGRGV
jgi:heme A synthase